MWTKIWFDPACQGRAPSELESGSDQITADEQQPEMQLLPGIMHRKGLWGESQYSHKLQVASQRPSLPELLVLGKKARSPQWRTKTLHHQTSFHHEEAPQVSAWDSSVQRKPFWSPYQKLTGLLQSQVEGFLQIFHQAHHQLTLPLIPSRRLNRLKRTKYGRKTKRRYCWGRLSTCFSILERMFGPNLSRHSMSGWECQRRVLLSSPRLWECYIPPLYCEWPWRNIGDDMNCWRKLTNAT